jgi:hypothetical protein
MSAAVADTLAVDLLTRWSMDSKDNDVQTNDCVLLSSKELTNLLR